MLNRNTIIDLWHEFEDVPFVERADCEQYLDLPEGFMGFPWGTTKQTIWDWFDKAYQPWGGLTELLEGNPQPERKFQIKTPAGVIECYSKHQGVDSDMDYPGVYIDIRYNRMQLADKQLGEMVACIELDSATGNMQTCVYKPGQDEPSHVEVYDTNAKGTPFRGTYKDFLNLYENEIAVLEIYDVSGTELDPRQPISDDADIVEFKRLGDSFEVTLNLNSKEVH